MLQDVRVSHVGVLATSGCSEIATRRVLHASQDRVREESGMCDAGEPCSCSAYMRVNIDDDEWYCMLYGERRVTPSPLSPQGLSIRNETSGGVIRSAISAQTTEWW
jgi:hypothetical protein